MEKIFLTTKDGVKIAADLYSVQNPISWLVLLHMMPATKESWRNFAIEAQNNGYESIAIDLRGHGQSLTYANLTRTNAKLNYQNFTDEEHQKSILDLKAAVDYLMKKREALPEKISFIGASIGANLSLQYIAENLEFKTAILLSAGLNYRGIATEPLVKKLQPRQKVLFVSAKDDIRSSGNSNTEENRLLFETAPDKINKQIKIYESGGHGTDILKHRPDLKNLIFEFLK